jgi:hypothetical protein
MKMERTECSETLAYKIQTPGNFPEESIQHSEYGESLRSCFVLGSGRSVHINSVLASKFPSQHFFTLLPSCGLKIQTVLRHLPSHVISKCVPFSKTVLRHMSSHVISKCVPFSKTVLRHLFSHVISKGVPFSKTVLRHLSSHVISKCVPFSKTVLRHLSSHVMSKCVPFSKTVLRHLSSHVISTRVPFSNAAAFTRFVTACRQHAVGVIL